MRFRDVRGAEWWNLIKFFDAPQTDGASVGIRKFPTRRSKQITSVRVCRNPGKIINLPNFALSWVLVVQVHVVLCVLAPILLLVLVLLYLPHH